MAQERIDDFIALAKDYAKAEKELEVQKWVYISIERKEGDNKIQLYHYDLPRELFERRRYVIEWRKAKCVCQYPKGNVQTFFCYYDKRLGTDNKLNDDLQRLISAKAQITKVQRKIDVYLAYNRAHNLFFDESSDAELQKAYEKLATKKENVASAEERLKLKIKQLKKKTSNEDNT